MMHINDSPVQLGDTALYDREADLFRIPLIGHKTFAALLIARNAPLPLTHLSIDEHRQSSKLGVNLHEHLEDEVRAAIGRGARQVATGLALATHEELADLD
jgi:hypothetical protein